jgi:hypothetical protein
MRSQSRQPTARLFIAALYGLAMLLMPLAHRPVHQATPDLSAYALPDGSAPLLCGADKSTSQGGRSVSFCDACRLASAPGLVVSSSTVTPPAERPSIGVELHPEELDLAQRFEAAARPRAPPALLA